VTQVAAGDEFLAVSDYTLPSKQAYADAHGYRILHYADAPTCCDESTSYACSLTNVAYKYCAFKDAMLTGGAAAEGGNPTGAQCSWIFSSDGDALFAPRAPALDAIVPDGLTDSSTVAVISAGADLLTTDVTTSTLEEGNFNSGAMIFQNGDKAQKVVDAVLAFDDQSYDGASGTACNCGTVGGCGDQWALCGAGEADPSLFSGFAAVNHPAVLQRALLYNNGAIVPIGALDWPPQAGEEAFVVNCAGNDPLGCVRYLKHYYYPDAEDPLPKQKDDLQTDPYKESLQKPARR